MAINKIDIVIQTLDKSSKNLKKIAANTQRTQQATEKLAGSNRKLGTAFNLVKVAAGAYAVVLGARVLKSIIDVGSSVEDLQVRLKLLFGSQQEGTKAFIEMAKYASKVPFSLKQIQRASGSLAVVSKDAKELAELMFITGNVAATAGLDFALTAENIQRAFAGGVAASEIFRERGIRALAGFASGAQVSAAETIAVFKRVFGKGGEFGKATDDLAATFTGTMSMIEDKIYNFQLGISIGFLGAIKKAAKDLDSFLGATEKETKRLAKSIGTGLGKAVVTLANAIKFLNEHSTELTIILKTLVAIELAKWLFAVSAGMGSVLVVLRGINLTVIVTTLIIGGLIILFLNLKKMLSMDEYKDWGASFGDMIDTLKADIKTFIDLTEKAHIFEPREFGTEDEGDDNTKDKLTKLAEMQKEFRAGFAETGAALKATWSDVMNTLGSATAEFINTFSTGIGTAFAGMITEGESFKASMKKVWKDMTKQFVTQVSIMIAKWAIFQLLTAGSGGGAGGIFALLGGMAKGGIVQGGLKVPSFATGGITTAPTLALIGDNPNRREAVVPLPDGRSIPVDLKGGVQSIGQLNILPNANIDQALMEKPMSFWVDLVQEKILPALNTLGKSGATTSMQFQSSR